MQGATCGIFLKYLWESGVADDLKLVAHDGSSAIAEINLVPTSGTRIVSSINFTCPSSGSMKWRIESTVSNPAIITLDSRFLGSGRNTRQTSETTLVAHAFYPATSMCNWARDNAAFGAFNADSDCPSISVVQSTQSVNTADNNLPDIVFDSLLLGTYEVVVNLNISHTATAVNSRGIRITDGIDNGATCAGRMTLAGTGNSRTHITCRMVKTFTTTGAVTFSLEGFEDATGSIQIENATSTQSQLTWTIRKNPTSSSESITLETIGEFWDVNIGGANVSLTTGDISAYAEITDGDLDMVINPGSKTAQIPCSTTNPSTGLTCSAGLESLGIVINTSSAGRYRACATLGHKIINSAGGIVETIFQWVETPNNAQTILQESNDRLYSASNIASSNSTNPITTCGNFNLNTSGQQTLRLMLEQNTTATVSSNLILSDRDSNFGQRDIHITVDKIDQQFPTPAFTDLTTSLDKKIEMSPGATGIRVLSMLFDSTGGTPTITRQDGTWVDSLSDNGIGDTTLNITAGIFSVAPNCVCVPAIASRFCSVGSAGTTTTTVPVFVSTVVPAGQDRIVHVICVGPQ